MNRTLSILILCIIAAFAYGSAGAQSSLDKPIVIEDGTSNGDVNADQSIDVQDLNILINILLGIESVDDYDSHVYVTDDYIIDVEDLNVLINMILGKASRPRVSHIVFEHSDTIMPDDTIMVSRSASAYEWQENDKILMYFNNDKSHLYQLNRRIHTWQISPLFSGEMSLKPSGTVNALFIPGISSYSSSGTYAVSGDVGYCDNGTYEIKEGDQLRVMWLNIDFIHKSTHVVLDGVTRPCMLQTIPHYSSVTTDNGFSYAEAPSTWLPYNTYRTGFADAYCIINPDSENSVDFLLSYTNSAREPRESYRRTIVFDDNFYAGVTLLMSGPHGKSASSWKRDLNFVLSTGKNDTSWAYDAPTLSYSARIGDILTITPHDGCAISRNGAFTNINISNPNVASFAKEGDTLVVLPKAKGTTKLFFTFTTATDAATTQRTLTLSVE